MSKLTESLIQGILGLVILILLVGSIVLYSDNHAAKIVTLERSMRDYNDALRHCQNTNKIIKAVKSPK